MLVTTRAGTHLTQVMYIPCFHSAGLLKNGEQMSKNLQQNKHLLLLVMTTVLPCATKGTIYHVLLAQWARITVTWLRIYWLRIHHALTGVDSAAVFMEVVKESLPSDSTNFLFLPTNFLWQIPARGYATGTSEVCASAGSGWLSSMCSTSVVWLSLMVIFLTFRGISLDVLIYCERRKNGKNLEFLL